MTPRKTVWMVLAVLLVAALAGGLVASQEGKGSSDKSPAFQGSREEAERFMGYHRSIQLSPQEEKILKEALTALPAPCCSKFTAATCCCECNMARTTWGLAKHLIQEKGAGVAEVREAVAAWHKAINPGGFSGDACFTGGCGRPFRHNGCGGMQEGRLVF